jgi:hypothetical protein
MVRILILFVNALSLLTSVSVVEQRKDDAYLPGNCIQFQVVKVTLRLDMRLPLVRAVVLDDSSVGCSVLLPRDFDLPLCSSSYSFCRSPTASSRFCKSRFLQACNHIRPAIVTSRRSVTDLAITPNAMGLNDEPESWRSPQSLSVG